MSLDLQFLCEPQFGSHGWWSMGHLTAFRIFIRFLIANGLRGIGERILPAGAGGRGAARSGSGVTLAKLGLSFLSVK